MFFLDSFYFFYVFPVRGTISLKPFGVMVSSTDQIPQAPVVLLFITPYFERPASSVRLVKAIHLRALP